MNITPNINIVPNNLKNYIDNIEINYSTPKEQFLGTFISRTLDLKLIGIEKELIPNEIGLSMKTKTKNLFNYIDNFNANDGGLTNTINSDGSITSKGKITKNYASVVNNINIDNILEDGELYTFSQKYINDYLYMQLRILNKSTQKYSFLTLNYKIKERDFVVDLSKNSYSVGVFTTTMNLWGDEVREITNYYQLEKGTVTIFEEYENKEKQPNFIIMKCEYDPDSKTAVIKGNDYSVKFDQYFDLELEYPLTLGELANVISQKIEVEIENINFANKNFIMEKPKIDNKYTYREIIGMIASAMGGIAFINNNNKLEFKNLTETDFEVDNVFEQIINDDKIGPIAKVALAREPIKDAIYLEKELPANENLLKLGVGVSSFGMMTTLNEDGSISYNGTVTQKYFQNTASIDCEIPIGEYTFSRDKKLNYNTFIQLMYEDNTTINYIIKPGSACQSFTTQKKVVKTRVYTSGLTIGETYNDTLYLQLLKGNYTDETLPDYKPYVKSETTIKIVNDYLVDDNREGAIQEIFDKLVSYVFYPAKITTYQGYKIAPFDIVNVEGKKILVTDINIKYPLLLDGYIGSSQMTKTEVEYKTAKGLEKRVIDAEAKVNKVEGEITLVVSDIGETNQQVTEIKSTTENITNTVSDIKQQVDDATGDIATIEKAVNTLEENVNGLQNTLETQGGSNLLLNSSGLFQDEYWEGDTSSITNTDIQNNFIAKACFSLQNGSMKQVINVVNGSYYIGFKYQKLLELANCKILINGTEIELTSSTLKEVDNIIEVSEHSITIELISDTNDACLVGDIIVVQSSKQSWSSNMNEIYTNTVKIGVGMEITSNTMNTRLLANADGVRIVNTTNNTVKTEFTDKGTKTDELEANTAKIAGMLIQKNNNQTWISSLL